jgi:type III pantothenate kinase
MDYLLVIDIGNTSTSVGLVGGRRILRVLRLPSGDAAHTARLHGLLRRATRGRRLAGAVLCSVVPKLNRFWVGALGARCAVKPIIVSHRIRLNVRVDYPQPATIGADRLANACAAWERYGGPVVVADFGTALTFDVVTGDGRYVGGVIAPGLPLMTEYLWEKTALLPRVRLTGHYGAWGRNTREAMRVGAAIGYRGMVREILQHVKRGLRGRVKFCATGGYAALAVHGLDKRVELLPELTLEGLVLIHEMNGARERHNG